MIARNRSFFMGSIFYSNVVLVWTFNTRSVYNLIMKKKNQKKNKKKNRKFGSILQWYLFPILWLFKIYSNEWAKKSFSLKWKKSQSYLFKTGQKFVVKKPDWSAYVWRTATGTFFKIRVISEVGSHFNQISLYLK